MFFTGIPSGMIHKSWFGLSLSFLFQMRNVDDSTHKAHDLDGHHIMNFTRISSICVLDKSIDISICLCVCHNVVLSSSNYNGLQCHKVLCI